MANKIRFTENDYEDDFKESGSEEEYTEREKYLVKKYKNSKKKKASDSEDEVMGFGSDKEDDEDDDNDLDDFLDDDKEKFENDSDIVSENDDDIPDSRAWGQKKSAFYNTNYVDQDYGSFTAEEEANALQEEKEARSIQLQLAKHLNEADFSLDVFVNEKSEKSKLDEDVVLSKKTKLKTDLSDLTSKQKLQLLRKESPEFDGLVDEFNEKLEETYNELEPILESLKTNNIPEEHPVRKFIQLKLEMHLTYCTNISVYLLFKASKQNIKNHPMLKRLVQLRELLIKLDDKYESSVRPEVEKLLEDIQAGHKITLNTTDNKKKLKSTEKPIKKLKILKQFEEQTDEEDEEGLFGNEEYEDDDEEGQKIEKEMQSMLDKLKENDEDEEMEEEEEEPEEGEEDEKRKITYEMAKNKGLTPHRKKELRNPRVKHRMKYRKALIRRKGAVRTVRTEDKRYSGEHSGIKATVRKGVKIH